MVEMYTGKPFLPGNSREDQITRIFGVFGGLSQDTWLEFRDFDEYKPKYSSYKAQDLSKLLPMIDDVGLSLLKQMLNISPSKRITAKNALNHKYFEDVKKSDFPYKL